MESVKLFCLLWKSVNPLLNLQGHSTQTYVFTRMSTGKYRHLHWRWHCRCILPHQTTCTLKMAQTHQNTSVEIQTENNKWRPNLHFLHSHIFQVDFHSSSARQRLMLIDDFHLLFGQGYINFFPLHSDVCPD